MVINDLNDRYKTWNQDKCVDWIISLNNEYMQYQNKLRLAFKEENIIGAHLEYIEVNDLHRMGVQKFVHKKQIIQHIKSLIQNGDNNNQYEEYDKEIISKLIQFGVGNKQQIIDAMDNVTNKNDVQQICYFLINKTKPTSISYLLYPSSLFVSSKKYM